MDLSVCTWGKSEGWKEDRTSEFKWQACWFQNERPRGECWLDPHYFPPTGDVRIRWPTESRPHQRFSSPRQLTHIFFPVLLTRFAHFVFTVPQQFKDVHLQLAGGRAVAVPVDAVFGQSDCQSLPSAALHRVVKDGSWREERRRREGWGCGKKRDMK